MQTRSIVLRDEWPVARKALLAREKALRTGMPALGEGLDWTRHHDRYDDTVLAGCCAAKR